MGFAVLMALAIGTAAFGQGLNNLWLMGYANEAGLPYGGITVDFITGAPQVDYHARPMSLSRTCATIANGSGDVLFYTNGVYIADRTDEPMTNGDGLNPSFYTADFYDDGLALSQANTVLPTNGDDGQYALIHVTADTIDNIGALVSLSLYRTTVDIALNEGNGEVVEKNEVILSDSLETSGITCVRHANGRDWWVVAHRSTDGVFMRLLITPDAVLGPYYQTIGVVRGGYAWNGIFSPDGTRFASIDGMHGLDVFNFDRCTGELSDARHAPLASKSVASSAAFSPSGDLVYATSYDRVYQYDCTASDLASSRSTVAEWDSTFDTYPVFSTAFWITRLAPNGKIYISTGNSTHYLHVINSPDLPGPACDVQQHAILLPAWNDNSIPYHPNYWLGPVDGTVCDSLGINVGVPERASPAHAGAYPNPANDAVTLNYSAQPGAVELDILDADGRMVLHEALPPWSSLHRLALEQVPAGLYVARLRWKEQSTTVRIAVTH